MCATERERRGGDSETVIALYPLIHIYTPYATLVSGFVIRYFEGRQFLPEERDQCGLVRLCQQENDCSGPSVALWLCSQG